MDFFTPEAVSELDTRIEKTHDVDQRKNYITDFIESILMSPSFLREMRSNLIGIGSTSLLVMIEF